MEHRGTFKKVGRSEERMYGPRGLLVCGYPQKEMDAFIRLVDKVGLADMRIIFTSSHDLETSVGDILTHENNNKSAGKLDIPRAVIMSGFTENELHSLMEAYREAGFVRQIWATVTPVSEEWLLKDLLTELQAEHRAMKNKSKR
jgi:hypothetical protein